MICPENRRRLFGIMLCGSKPSARVQPAEIAALFGLLQGDSGRLDYERDIGGGGFVVNARGLFTRSLSDGVIQPLPSEGDSASVRASKATPEQGDLPASPKDCVPWPSLAYSFAARSACLLVLRSCPRRSALLGRRTAMRLSPAPTASISMRATSLSPRRRSAATCRRYPRSRSAITSSI